MLYNTNRLLLIYNINRLLLLYNLVHNIDLIGGYCFTTSTGDCCCCLKWLNIVLLQHWFMILFYTMYFYSNNKGLWLHNIDRWFFYTCIWNCSSIKHAKILTNVHVGLLVKLVKSWYLPKSYFSMSYNVT